MASYNGKPVEHESLITRGIFVFKLSADGGKATLASAQVAWKELPQDMGGHTGTPIGTMHALPAAPPPRKGHCDCPPGYDADCPAHCSCGTPQSPCPPNKHDKGNPGCVFSGTTGCFR